MTGPFSQTLKPGGISVWSCGLQDVKGGGQDGAVGIGGRHHSLLIQGIYKNKYTVDRFRHQRIPYSVRSTYFGHTEGKNFHRDCLVSAANNRMAELRVRVLMCFRK